MKTAKPQKLQPQSVTCEVCNRTVPPEAPANTPIAYVHFNGHNVCWDCVRHGKTAQFRQI